MGAVRITHVSIRAEDIEESVRFFVDMFGDENVEKIPTPNLGGPVPVQWLRLGELLQLHLFTRDMPAAPRFHHFGVGVKDLDRFHEIYLKAKDRGIFDDTTYGHRIYELPGGDVQMYILDPTGNLIEVDYPQVEDLDRSIVTDIKKMTDRWPQPEEAIESTLFLQAR